MACLAAVLDAADDEAPAPDLEALALSRLVIVVVCMYVCMQ